jgi:tetratricopeptide (TPR) repeat protein
MKSFQEQFDALFADSPSAAEQLAMKASARSPKDPEPLVFVAVARLKQRNHAGAVEVLDQALRLNPRHVTASALRASTLDRMDDASKALDAWQYLARLMPQARDAWERIARNADVVGLTDVALEARRNLAGLLPGNPVLAADLAVALSRNKVHAEAVRVFDRVEMIEPGFLQRHPVEAHYAERSRSALTATR